MQVLLTTICIICFSLLAKSQPCSIHNVQIVCSEIANVDYDYVGVFLRCIVDKLVTSKVPESSVSSVLDSNRQALNNLNQILGLYSGDAVFSFIPRGITSKLPNLKVLNFENNYIQSLNKDNLKEFGSKLEYLSLRNNKLTSIDADLFQYNSNLRVVYLNGNPIRNIEPQFFANLKNIQQIVYMSFMSAGCISQLFSTALGHHMSTFIWNNGKCFDISARIETENLIERELCLEAKIARYTERFDNIISELNHKLDKLLCRKAK